MVEEYVNYTNREKQYKARAILVVTVYGKRNSKHR